MSQETVIANISNVSPVACSLTLIAVGSNLSFTGETPKEVINAAFLALEAHGIMIRSQSRYFSSPAFPAGSGPDFVNAAAVVEAGGSAAALLEQLHEVEMEMGRTRTRRWGARTLDLDLIAMGQQLLPDAQTHQYWRDLPLEAQKTDVPPELILPHPRLSERAFVLVPLMDVAPDWCHPVTGHSVRAMHGALSAAARAEVVPL
jgi:2-amino-4-hydroxy-6-hydroxymethyldihydropteridine diphosphokinase